MTTQLEHTTRMFIALENLGFYYAEASQLRRISMTLHRWNEAECNGDIQREGDSPDSRPYRVYGDGRRGYLTRTAIPDRERGALKRLKAIVDARNARPGKGVLGWPNEPVIAYRQGDPRGASLYIVRASDIPAGESIDSYYSRGVAVHK